MSEKRRDNKGRILRSGESQRKDGKYEYKYTDSCGERHSVYSWKLVATDKPPEGKRDGASLRDMIKEIERDLLDNISNYDAKKITVDTLFERLISLKRNRKPTTIAMYRSIYNSNIKDRFGNMRVIDIRHSIIKEFYLQKLEHSSSIGTIKLLDGVLGGVLRLAVKDGYIRTDPSEGIVKELSVNLPTEKKKKKKHALSKFDQERFMSYLLSDLRFSDYIPIFIFLLGTGVRIGELAALQWSDCDFENMIIHINKTLSYKNLHGKGYEYLMTSAKSSYGEREIPMFHEVKNILQMLWENGHPKSQIEVGGYNNFVFMSSKGLPIKAVNVDRTIDTIVERFNETECKRAMITGEQFVPMQKFSVHILRHTFCTRLCEVENNLKVIQEIMGHSSIAVTTEIYAEATTEQKQKTFNKIDSGDVLVGATNADMSYLFRKHKEALDAEAKPFNPLNKFTTKYD